MRRQQETPQVGRLLLLYVDETVADATPFGDVRQRAYKIMPKDALQSAGQRMSVRPASKLTLRWQAVDGLAERIRRHLRPLYGVLDFASVDPDNPWLAALAWAKSVFAKQQRLSQRPLAECPEATLPKRLRPYLLTFDADGKPTGLHADRYEFWLYRQVRKRLQVGRTLPRRQPAAPPLQRRTGLDRTRRPTCSAQMDIPWLRQPIETQLNALATELHAQWLAFNRELRQGKLKHLDYDSQTKTLTWRKPKADKNAAREEAFYEQLPFCDVADVFRFVNEQCQFLLGADAAAAALRQEGRRRRQPDGGDHCPSDEPRQSRHVAHQRHPLPRAGGDLPAVPAPGLAAGGQRPDQQRHRRACRSSRTTRSTSTCSTAPSTARSSAWSGRP